VLTLANDAIAGLTVFVPPTGPRLFPDFGLPLDLPETAGGASPGAPRHS
jgi:hypothetical protein